jgi:hypothetical protein
MTGCPGDNLEPEQVVEWFSTTRIQIEAIQIVILKSSSSTEPIPMTLLNSLVAPLSEAVWQIILDRGHFKTPEIIGHQIAPGPDL